MTRNDRRAQVIVLANHKGGVGKSTTATNLAAGLARAGHRTLLVDADAQGHATYWFANEDEQPNGDLYTVIKEGMPAAEAITATRIAGLDLEPATLDLAALDLELVSMTLREYRIKRHSRRSPATTPTSSSNCRRASRSCSTPSPPPTSSSRP